MIVSLLDDPSVEDWGFVKHHDAASSFLIPSCSATCLPQKLSLVPGAQGKYSEGTSRNFKWRCVLKLNVHISLKLYKMLEEMYTAARA